MSTVPTCRKRFQIYCKKKNFQSWLFNGYEIKNSWKLVLILVMTYIYSLSTGSSKFYSLFYIRENCYKMKSSIFFRKLWIPENLFYRSSHRRCSVKACIFIKIDTLEQVFSCEFREISKNTFSYRTPPLAASGFNSNENLFLATTNTSSLRPAPPL